MTRRLHDVAAAAQPQISFLRDTQPQVCYEKMIILEL
jgi:hypothetical protein